MNTAIEFRNAVIAGLNASADFSKDDRDLGDLIVFDSLSDERNLVASVDLNCDYDFPIRLNHSVDFIEFDRDAEGKIIHRMTYQAGEIVHPEMLKYAASLAAIVARASIEIGK